MRPGFLLPMALVLTAITAVVVGGLASYCTTSFRTSELYLSRTRCRLAAQSAIEEAKLRFQAEITQSGKGGLIADPTNAGFSQSMADLAEAVNATFPATTNINGCVVRVQAGTAGMDSDETVIPFFATATYGNSNTSVTLQENVKFVVSDASVFNYAYFANSGGTLDSSRVTVNGDIRANGDFTVKNATINGFIIATNNVNLSSAYIKTASAYNNYLKKSTDDPFYYPTFSPARPTDPLSSGGDAWAGGFDALADGQSADGLIEKTFKSVSGKKIVQEKADYLLMPRIDGFGEEKGLDFYRNYAKTCGGTLCCSNCVIVDGSPKQIFIAVKNVTFTQPSQKSITTYNYSSKYKVGMLLSGWVRISNNSTGYTLKVDEEIRFITNDGYAQLSPELQKNCSQAAKNTYYKKNSPSSYTFSVDVSVTEDVNRELRRIRVKDGYYVDYDKLNGTDEEKDRTTTAGVSLSGQTTEALRPFREDDNAKLNAITTADKGAVVLIGTWDRPIVLNGPVVFESDVLIRGFVEGRGTIYSGRNIHIIGDINYKHPPTWQHNGGKPLSDNTKKDMLVLISRGSIVIGNYFYVNGASNSSDEGYNNDDWTKLKSYLTGGKVNGRSYMSTDYTLAEDIKNRSGSSYSKVKYQSNKVTDSSPSELKRYESVIGDYFFDKTHSRLSALYDRNAYESLLGIYFNSDEDDDHAFESVWRASFFSDAISNYLNERYTSVSSNDAKRNDKNFTYWEDLANEGDSVTIFNGGTDCWIYWCGSASRRHYALNSDSILAGLSNPKINCIRKIDGVLYSSRGIFGVLGGKGGTKSFATINGAVIGQDECIVPFDTTRFTCYYTLNWDLRLNVNSAEGVNTLGLPKSSGGGETRPYTFSWQEVPDSYNQANP